MRLTWLYLLLSFFFFFFSASARFFASAPAILAEVFSPPDFFLPLAFRTWCVRGGLAGEEPDRDHVGKAGHSRTYICDVRRGCNRCRCRNRRLTICCCCRCRCATASAFNALPVENRHFKRHGTECKLLRGPTHLFALLALFLLFLILATCDCVKTAKGSPT